MSETDENGTDEPVSMTKKPRAAAASGRKPQIADLPLPTTMKAAFAALAVVIIGNIVRAAAVALSSDHAFVKSVKHANLKAKKPKNPYTAADMAKDIHAIRPSYIVTAVLSVLVTIFLMWGLRRARSASGSRWVLIFALFFTGGLGGIVPPYGFPGFIQGAGVVIGVAALASIALVFAPPSSAYARECREASLPPELRGQPRPKLFGPRPTPATRQAPARPATARPVSAGGGKSKSKARSDAEAVARGAELARSRARAASKSRRTDA